MVSYYLMSDGMGFISKTNLVPSRILVLLGSMCYFAIPVLSQETNQNTNLADSSLSTKRKKRGGKKKNRGDKSSDTNRKNNKKLLRSKSSLLERIQSEVIIPDDFKVQDSCKFNHHFEGPAILTAAMSKSLMTQDVKRFVGTARKVGYNDDIVVAISPNSRPKFLTDLVDYKTITYLISPICNNGTDHNLRCHFKLGKDTTPNVSINMIRYFLYLWWAKTYYAKDALIMIADFADSFFQSNPFLYHIDEWKPPISDLVVFQEPYPNKVIYRCAINSAWIEMCYSNDDYNKIKSNTISCSGISMGTAEAIMIYAFLLTEQLKPSVRYGGSFLSDMHLNHDRCHASLGIDQGFHNYLVYSGQLSRYLNVRVYQQGEGPANTIGGYFGPSNTNQMNLTLREMNILKGEEPNAMFYNFNGEASPIVHQFDRFRHKQFKDEEASLSSFQGLK